MPTKFTDDADGDGGNKNAEEIDAMEYKEEIENGLDEEEREKHSYLLSLPPHECEVRIGGLPKDIEEEELRDLCEDKGEIFKMRLGKASDTGYNIGYGVVSFKTKEAAQKAIEELHNKEFKGKTLSCSLTESGNRPLFISDIPKNWTKYEFKQVIDIVGPGVENIELIKDPTNSGRNRGFAFVLYYNNACANYSRDKLNDYNFSFLGNGPTAMWARADRRSSPEYSAVAIAQVKALYVKNIPENTSRKQLKELFQRHGEVKKLAMPLGKGGKHDFCYLHYAERSSALEAVKDTERYEINGQQLEVVLAKPQTERKHDPSYAERSSALKAVKTAAAAPPPRLGGRRGNRKNSSSGGSGRDNSDEHDGNRNH